MKRTILGFALGILFSGGLVWASITEDYILFGYGGTNYAKAWVDSSGRLSQQNLTNSGSSALDIWPTSGTRPTTDSIAELTLHRTMWSDSTMERFNVSAMATANGAAYRFGVEASNGGVFRDVIFCFENVSPGVANCQLKITTSGVYATDDSGTTWRRL